MATILIIGSVAWDEVVRLDAPLRVGSHDRGRWLGKRLGGGAANTAMALARAQDRALVVSAVGNDPDGARLVAELAELGVDVTLIQRHADVTTRSLIPLEQSGERTVIDLARAAVSLPPDLEALPGECCYVRRADAALTLVLARRSQVSTVVAHVPPVTPGRLPAQILVGSASDLDHRFLADPFAVGQQIAGELLAWTVVTFGSEGAIAYGAGTRIEARAPRVEVVDSTGAGDVFAAGLVHALAAGDNMRTALKTAVAWSSASVRYEGTELLVDFSIIAPDSIDTSSDDHLALD